MYTMKRLYIRTKNEWKAIGWYCTKCGSVVLDELATKHCFSSVPSPKVTVLKKRLV
jgi:uncharacterized OB-fold protein